MPRPSRLALAATLLAALPACSDSHYKVIEVPFCATDDPGIRADLANSYVMLSQAADAYSAGGFAQSWTGPQNVGSFSSGTVRLALIECPERASNVSIEWAKQLSESNVPTVCGGQRVVFNQVLESVVDERSKGLGYAGFLRFPKADLECAAGTLVRADDHTLHQIIDDFVQSVDRYHVKHEKLPASFEELATDTKAPPLPSDPWGTALKFETESSSAGAVVEISLRSAGPDKAFETEDDVEVLTKQQGSSTSITVFPDVDQSMSGDYRALLRSRGVE